ncbi:Tripeptidyl-peptidase 2, partial [Stegodyphus mimosarum]
MIHLADKILAILNTIEVLASIGSKVDKKELPDYKKIEQQKHCIIEALVKKGKAMCDYLLLKAGINAEMDSNKETSETSDHLESEKMSTEIESVDPSAAENVKNLSQITLDAVDEVYCELQKWSDMSDSKVSSFTEKHALIHCHYGRALKILLKQQDEKRNLDTEKKCIELYKKVDWNHCAYFYESSLLVRYPLSYRLF